MIKLVFQSRLTNLLEVKTKFSIESAEKISCNNRIRRFPMAREKSTKKIKRRKITFSLDSSGAKEVFLMGEFNNLSPKKHPMKSVGDGTWAKAVMLFPGTHEYKFLVDGEWKEDPRNDQRCANCFGTYNSVFNLPVS